MPNLPLLKSLKEQEEQKSRPPKLTEGIQYDEYLLNMVNEKKKTVFIPKRESGNFEDALLEVDIMTESEVRKLLRKFNGVTEV